MSTPWTVTLGTDDHGANLEVDLTDAPHILLCGTSGSGKSVGVQVILAGLHEHGDARTTQVTILDPKRVEFRIWEASPVVARVVTDRAAMVKAVQALVVAMDRRYRDMERAGIADVRDWDGTRHAVPRVFLVCDELADLTMAGRDRESKDRAGIILGCLTRIAQLGRAAGFHLILATQRPAADTLPGNLRANLGTRWAFRVRTRAESRIALDAPGAESLPAQPGASLLSWRGSTGRRCQGRYLSREDMRSAVSGASRGSGWRMPDVRSLGPTIGGVIVLGAMIWDGVRR